MTPGSGRDSQWPETNHVHEGAAESGSAGGVCVWQEIPLPQFTIRDHGTELLEHKVHGTHRLEPGGLMHRRSPNLSSDVKRLMFISD